MIVNFLRKNAPNVWKIIKYHDHPYTHDSLTPREIDELIATDWNSNAMDEFAVVPIRFSGQSLTKQDIQIRISLLDNEAVNRTTSKIRVMLQFICNNNSGLICSPYSPAEDRAFALMQETLTVLNGAELPEIGTVLNIDGQADPSTGWYAAKFSNTYSGYECIMSCSVQ